MHAGQRLAVIGILASALLAIVKILAGLTGHSTAVVADGLESAGDVLSSSLVLVGLKLAAKPADEEHPYGHGRAEILTALFIGLVLTTGGALISYGSLHQIGHPHEALASYVVWPLAASFAIKGSLAIFKFRQGRRIKSAALTADAWNDAMDTLSAVAALMAVGLALWDPVRFLDADRYGGFIVGLIVLTTGVRIARDTVLQLMDTMPEDRLMHQIRDVATSVPGACRVEKCYARKTGLRYHVDLHLEVDPEMTVRQSHKVAHDVQQRIREQLDWVADVLVHVEPAQ